MQREGLPNPEKTKFYTAAVEANKRYTHAITEKKAALDTERKEDRVSELLGYLLTAGTELDVLETLAGFLGIYMYEKTEEFDEALVLADLDHAIEVIERGEMLAGKSSLYFQEVDQSQLLNLLKSVRVFIKSQLEIFASFSREELLVTIKAAMITAVKHKRSEMEEGIKWQWRRKNEDLKGDRISYKGRTYDRQFLTGKVIGQENIDLALTESVRVFSDVLYSVLIEGMNAKEPSFLELETTFAAVIRLLNQAQVSQLFLHIQTIQASPAIVYSDQLEEQASSTDN